MHNHSSRFECISQPTETTVHIISRTHFNTITSIRLYVRAIYLHTEKKSGIEKVFLRFSSAFLFLSVVSWKLKKKTTSSFFHHRLSFFLCSAVFLPQTRYIQCVKNMMFRYKIKEDSTREICLVALGKSSSLKHYERALPCILCDLVCCLLTYFLFSIKLLLFLWLKIKENVKKNKNQKLFHNRKYIVWIYQMI